jgi:topoisomerase-4 subunit A
LSGRIKPPDGATFVGVMMGDDDERYLLATSAGYGFVVRLGDIQTRAKAGKAVLTVPKGALVLPPVRVHDLETDRVAAVLSTGNLLAFPVSDLPEMARGKGNKIIGIPGKAFTEGKESMVAIASVPMGRTLKLLSGKRRLSYKHKDLQDYLGERGKRGSKLPRGYQAVKSAHLVEE